MKILPRADWGRTLGWLERLRTPGFNWDLAKISELSENVECWVAGNSCVFIQKLGPTAEILLLATAPEHHRTGGMRKLLEELFGQLSQHEEWWLEVHEKNLGARELYARLGFQETGRRPRYYSDGGAAILMSRRSL